MQETPEIRTWRPNRHKPETQRMKGIVSLVLLGSAGLILLVCIGGWERFENSGTAVAAVIWALMYVFFAFLVNRWNRGVLPVAASLAIIFAIFAAVAAPGWFSRDKAGFSDPLLDPSILGLLVLLIVPAQILLIVVSLAGFRQEWHVEEEVPSGAEPQPGEYLAPGGPGDAAPAPSGA